MQYIYQNTDWNKFSWDGDKIQNLLLKIKKAQGYLFEISPYGWTVYMSADSRGRLSLQKVVVTGRCVEDVAPYRRTIYTSTDRRGRRFLQSNDTFRRAGACSRSKRK